MRITTVCLCVLFIPCFRLDIAAQSKLSPAVLRQVVEQMIRDGEITRSCLEAGGYHELVAVDYEHYNDDRIPEVVVVQKAGCIHPAAFHTFGFIVRLLKVIERFTAPSLETL